MTDTPAQYSEVPLVTDLPISVHWRRLTALDRAYNEVIDAATSKPRVPRELDRALEQLRWHLRFTIDIIEGKIPVEK